jgi:hypothetical protein
MCAWPRPRPNSEGQRNAPMCHERISSRHADNQYNGPPPATADSGERARSTENCESDRKKLASPNWECAMTQPIPEAIQAERVTTALRRTGVLGEAYVNDVTVESSRDTILSRIIRVRLTYSVPTDGAPRSLIFKTWHPDRVGDALHAGRQEVAFYAQVAPLMAASIVPRCFEAYRDAATSAWHLLLEDLTETHAVPTRWPLPPTRQQCGAIIRAHARLHASWWNSPRLGVSVGTWLDADAMDRQMQLVASDFQRFADRAGNLLSRGRRQLYEQLLGAAPRLLQRYHSHRNFTITQGDAHVWNTFLPRDN